MNVAKEGPPSLRKSLAVSRERLAWGVLLGAFSLCVVLAVAMPLASFWFYESSSVAQGAGAQGIGGVTLVRQPNLPPDAVLRVAEGERRADLAEGSVLETDAASQMSVELFDGSTLTIFPNTVVTLREMRRPRFGGSDTPLRVVVLVRQGRVRAQVAARHDRVRHFEIQTTQAPAPHGGILLEPGSYAIEASNEVTHVAVRSGTAQVGGGTGHPVLLQPNERAEIPLGRAAVGPLPAQRNLLVNSDFENLEVSVPTSQGLLAPGWAIASDQGGDGGMVDGTVDVVTAGATRALHFVRQGGGSNHGETGVEQEVDKLVGDYLALVLRLDVRIVKQSLGGGGEQSSEFPLIVRVDYHDTYGQPQYWTHGFYCTNPARYNIRGGAQIPCDTRRPVEINLKEELNDPLTLDRIRLYASGWDWDVYVSDVELSAE